MGDLSKAAKNLQIALTFDPNFAQAHFIYAQIEKERGDTLAAVRHLRKVLTVQPDAGPANEMLATFGKSEDWLAKATTAQTAKNLKKARTDVETALAIDPNNAKAALFYAQLLEKMGDKKAAKQAYQQLLQIDAKSAVGQAAVKRLSGK